MRAFAGALISARAWASADFHGRYSLHRVTLLRGPPLRYVAIFWYIERPDMVGKPEGKKQLDGWALPMHLERVWFRGDIFIGASPILISFLEHF